MSTPDSTKTGPTAPPANGAAATDKSGDQIGSKEADRKPVPLATKLLLLLIFGPILVYFAVFYNSREAELKRYHREMVALEEALVQSLKDGAEVLKAGSAVLQVPADQATQRPAPATPCTVIQKCALTKQEKEPKTEPFATISYTRYADLALEPYLPCRLGWHAESNKLALKFTLDRPVARAADANATPENPKVHRVDYRSRYSGTIDLHRRLLEITRESEFDALLVANAKGELILKLGPSQALFSALPVLTAPGWDQAIESEPKERELAQRPFIPTGIRQVEREVAGTHYTLFPREVVLTPTALTGGSTSCRSLEAGGETLRLRVVGFVASRRLTLVALRPAGGFYWFFFLSYLAAFFYVVHDFLRRRTRKFWRNTRTLLEILFGFSAGILIALTVALLGLNSWRDSALKDQADLAIQSIASQLTQVRDEICKNLVSESKPHLASQSSFWLFRKDGALLSATNACRDRQPRFDPNISNFVDENGPVYHSYTSRKDGRRTTLAQMQLDFLVQDEFRMKVPFTGIEVASFQLSTFDVQNFPPEMGFGAALVDADDKNGKWHLLHDSEVRRQTGADFLTDFSNPTCLKIQLAKAERTQGEYCSGDLRGQKARIFLTKPKIPQFEEWKKEGSLALLTYAYQKPHDLSIEGAVLSTLWLGLPCIPITLALAWLLARVAGWLSTLIKSEESGWLKKALNWLAKTRLSFLAVALVVGVFSFGWAWANESDLYFAKAPTDNISAVKDCPEDPPIAIAQLELQNPILYRWLRPVNDRQADLAALLEGEIPKSMESRFAFLDLWTWPLLGFLGTLAAIFAFALQIRLPVDSPDDQKDRGSIAALLLGMSVALVILFYGQELVASVVAAIGALMSMNEDIRRILRDLLSKKPQNSE